MNFGHLSYLVLMLVFTLVPLFILWSRHFDFLKKNIRIILIMAFIAILYAVISAPFAELNGAWFYTSSKILGPRLLGCPIEDFIFIILVSLDISSGVLSFIHSEKTGKL